MAHRSYVERLPTRTIRLHPSRRRGDKRAFGKNFTRTKPLSNLMEPDETPVEASATSAVITPNDAYDRGADHSSDLPYEAGAAPRYRGRGDIPAWEMINPAHPSGLFLAAALLHHIGPPGQFITSRSEKSILSRSRVGDLHTRFPRLPSTSERLSTCTAWAASTGAGSKRRRPSCLYPKMSPNLDNDHRLLPRSLCQSGRQVKKAALSAAVSKYDLSGRQRLPQYGYPSIVRRAASKWRRNILEDAVLKLMRKPPFVISERLNADSQPDLPPRRAAAQLIPISISSHLMHGARHAPAGGQGWATHFDREQVQDLTLHR